MRVRVLVGIGLALATVAAAASPPRVSAAPTPPPRASATAATGTAWRIEPDVHYRMWTVEDGLPTGSVTTIGQTSDGYLWIATFDGLVRFDGVRMQVFNRSDIPGLASNRCVTLLVDPEGTLWVGTEEGSVLRVQNGRFRAFGAGEGLPTGQVGLRWQEEGRRMWAYTTRGYLRFEAEQWVPPSATAPVPEEFLRQPLTVREDGGGLRVFERGRFVDYPPPAGSSWQGAVYLGQEADGATWVALGKGPALRLLGGNVSVAGPAVTGDSRRLRFGRFWHRGRGGRLWALEGGILHVRENGRWQTFATPVPEIVDPSPRMYEDREGSLWIGGDRGLVQAIATPVRVFTPAGQVENQNIYSIAMDPQGRVWGTTQGEPFLLERGTFSSLKTRSWWPRDWIVAMEPDAADAAGALFASSPSALYRVWPGRRHEKIGTFHAPTWDVLRDRKGLLWAATEAGLERCREGVWKNFDPQQGLASSDARVLLESRDGGIWVGTYGGLSRVEGETIRSWKAADGLSSEHIRSLYEDPSGALWIGTYDGGLDRLAGGRIIAIRKQDGLYDDGVFAIVDDGQGNLWMSSNRGVYSAARSELDAFASGKVRSVSCRAWKGSDGMPSSECNGGRQPSGFRAADGTLWFPTQKGIAVFDSRAVSVNTSPPVVVVEEVTTDRRTIPREGPIDLAPGERRLEVRYTTATFIRPEGARFRHQLVGFDPDWVEDGSRRFAQYAFVPPGRYEMRILAANSDGIWGDEGVSLPIRVRPHWWQTAWLRWGAAFLGLAVVALAYGARMSQLKHRRARQDAFARRLIESQEAERKRIAGELHDGIGQTLTVIRNRALLGLRDGGGHQMHEISEAAGEGIEEVRKVAYGLRPYQLDRLGLSRALEAVIDQAGASSGIPIAGTIGEVDGAFAKDDEINVYRIVQEGVSNLVQHARARSGRVTAVVREREVEITIEDDGAGFDPGALRATGGGGLGLSGIEERARILGGKCTIRSSPGQGTTVTVLLPRGVSSR